MKMHQNSTFNKTWKFLLIKRPLLKFIMNKFCNFTTSIQWATSNEPILFCNSHINNKHGDIATLLTATTFKTEALRQMKRKPDQLQSKINRQFFEQQLITWLERKENVSPTTFKIQNRWRFLQNSTLICNFTKILIKRKRLSTKH